MEKDIFCPKCKRPIPDPDITGDNGIVYCRGCNFYFLDIIETDRKRSEIKIPNGSSVLRLRLEENSIGIKFRWFGNYRFTQVLVDVLGDVLKEEMNSVISVLSYFINRTEVNVTEKMLTIVHKPIDLLPDTYFQRHYVKQLFVRKIDSKSKISDCYGLYAKVSTGEERILLWNLHKNVLLFLEQEIERIFGIEDIEVEDEVVD